MTFRNGKDTGLRNLRRFGTVFLTDAICRGEGRVHG